jgi:hypothetical protein
VYETDGATLQFFQHLQHVGLKTSCLLNLLQNSLEILAQATALGLAVEKVKNRFLDTLYLK